MAKRKAKKRIKKDKWIIDGLIKEGGINVINVAHDNCCAFLKNGVMDKSKECNCNAEISHTILDESKGLESVTSK